MYRVDAFDSYQPMARMSKTFRGPGAARHALDRAEAIRVLFPAWSVVVRDPSGGVHLEIEASR